jgi:hypothetical protein
MAPGQEGRWIGYGLYKFERVFRVVEIRLVLDCCLPVLTGIFILLLMRIVPIFWLRLRRSNIGDCGGADFFFVIRIISVTTFVTNISTNRVACMQFSYIVCQL